MKRNFILLCVSALVLALGLSTTAGAEVSATAAAKKGAKKGKSCKGAGKSTVATAQKKGKKKTCKAKGKGAQPDAASLSDGAYGDAASKVELSVSGGASTVTLEYTPPGGCATISYTSQPVALTKSGDTWTASETKGLTIGGQPANAKWDLTVKEPGLTYALNLTLESTLPVIGLCKWEGHPTGTLTKVG